MLTLCVQDVLRKVASQFKQAVHELGACPPAVLASLLDSTSSVMALLKWNKPLNTAAKAVLRHCKLINRMSQTLEAEEEVGVLEFLNSNSDRDCSHSAASLCQHYSCDILGRTGLVVLQPLMPLVGILVMLDMF